MDVCNRIERPMNVDWGEVIFNLLIGTLIIIGVGLFVFAIVETWPISGYFLGTIGSMVGAYYLLKWCSKTFFAYIRRKVSCDGLLDI